LTLERNLPIIYSMARAMSIDWEKIGKKIRQVRVAKSMTQAELAEKTDMFQGDVSDIELGRRHVTLEILMRIAKALDVDVKVFL
jgi:transcriptional regulator with XRE-family HTH domain